MYSGKEALIVIQNGIEETVSRIASTMGPSGSSVLIRGNHTKSSIVTKDGVTISNFINFKDDRDIGAEMVREVTNNTLEDVGDGTTTSCYLLHMFIKEYLAVYGDISSRTFVDVLDAEIQLVINDMLEGSIPADKEKLKNLIGLSVKQNESLIDFFNQIIDKEVKLVNVEYANNGKSYLEINNGMRLNGGWGNIAFTNVNGTDVLYNFPKIIVTDYVLETNHLMDIAKHVRAKEPLVIFCKEFKDSLVPIIEKNNETFPICIVRVSGTGDRLKDIFSDLCTYTGATFISKDNNKRTEDISIPLFGELQKFTANKYNSVLTNVMNKKTLALITDLNTSYQEINIPNAKKVMLKERIERLNGMSASLFIWADSELERKELFDRAEDAAGSLKSAHIHGLSKAAGVTYYTTPARIDEPSVITNVLESLYLKIIANSKIDHKEGLFYDFSKKEYVTADQYEHYDSTHLLIVALKNAWSAAKAIIEIEHIV